MKILVTGGAGFIGSHLVEELLSNENEILIFDNCLTGKKENLDISGNFKFINDDFGSESSLDEIEKFICKFNNQSRFEHSLNNQIKLIQIIGNQFCDQNYKPLISHNTGFNLSILKSMNGKIEDLMFKEPTILFSQKGLWTIKIGNDDIKINSKDTFSVPLDTKISISVDNIEDCYLNCVSKI